MMDDKDIEALLKDRHAVAPAPLRESVRPIATGNGSLRSPNSRPRTARTAGFRPLLVVATACVLVSAIAIVRWSIHDRDPRAARSLTSVDSTLADRPAFDTTVHVTTSTAPETAVPTSDVDVLVDTSRSSIQPTEAFALPFPLGQQAGATTMVPGLGIVGSQPTDESYTTFELYRIGADRVPVPLGLRHGNLWQVLGGRDGRLYLRDGMNLTAYRFQDGLAILDADAVSIDAATCRLEMSQSSVSCGSAVIALGDIVPGGGQVVLDESYVEPAGLPQFSSGVAECGDAASTPGRCVTFELPGGKTARVVPVGAENESRSTLGLAIVVERESGTDIAFIKGGPIIGMENTFLYVWSQTKEACEVFDLSTLAKS